MGQYVVERRHRLDVRRARARYSFSPRARRRRRRCDACHRPLGAPRRLPQAAPQPRRRPPHEQQLAVALDEHRHRVDRARRLLRLRRRDTPRRHRRRARDTRSTSGQREQPGDAGVHTVAPSSIIAWLKSPARCPPSARTSSPARAHTCFFSAASSAAPASASTRASTRTTLPSTIGAASPNAMLAMAPAVYSPTPGSSRSPSAVARKAPAVATPRPRAPPRAGCARARSSRARPSATARRRAAPRRARAPTESAPSSARSTASPSRRASAAA